MLAPASARPWATDRPMPAPAPETIAVLPLRLKSGRTLSVLGGWVLSLLKTPSLIAPSDILAYVVVVIVVVELKLQ